MAAPAPGFRRVLVTGASGFIGAALCQRLTAAGIEVIGTARQARAGLSPAVQWRHGRLEDAAFVRQLVQRDRPEAIFHLASFVSGNRSRDVVLEAFHSNLTSTVNLLSAFDGDTCGKIVLTGSLEEPAAGSDEAACSPYAAAKWAADGYARMFHALYAMPVATARLFMVYGPAQIDRRKLVPFVIDAFIDGRSPELASGTRPVDWIYVDDVVDAYLAIAAAPGSNGRSFDVGSGSAVTVRAVVETIERLMAPSQPPRFGAVADRPLERIRVADTAALTALTGWRCRTGLEDGLAQTIAWHRAHPLAA